MSTKILTTIDHAASAIKNAPRIRGTCIHWAADISVPTIVALAILTATDQNEACFEIAKQTKVSVATLKNLARGNKSEGGAWTDLRDRLSAADVKWNGDGRRKAGGATLAAGVPSIEPPLADLLIVHEAALGADRFPAPRAVAPVAEVAVHTKATPLAVTNKGEVITATPPTAVTAPSPMVAAPGAYATKTDATRTVLDTKTRDILVITTRRIEYGTPEWCAKMVEINSKPKA